MGLHPNQEILGAVQQGMCSQVDDANPFEATDTKRFMGWQQGHDRMARGSRQQQEYDNLSWWRKAKCWAGFHVYNLTRVPGRPHINPVMGNIDRRDFIIKKYSCAYCPATFFIGLDG